MHDDRTFSSFEFRDAFSSFEVTLCSFKLLKLLKLSNNLHAYRRISMFGARNRVQHHHISLDLALEVCGHMILRFNLEDAF